MFLKKIKSIGILLFFIPIFYQAKIQNITFENLEKIDVIFLSLFAISFLSILFSFFELFGILLIFAPCLFYSYKYFTINDFYIYGFLIVLFSDFMLISLRKPIQSKPIHTPKAAERPLKAVSQPKQVSKPNQEKAPKKPLSSSSRPKSQKKIDPWENYNKRNKDEKSLPFPFGRTKRK